MSSEKVIPRLGVNIDHVATLRQARGENYPSVVEAAQICLNKGADQITIHLREDRRHIQDTDVEAVMLVTKRFGKPLNLEMGCNDEIVDIAIATAPEWVCLVPENRMERTTEGGLNVIDPNNYQKVLKTCQRLKEALPKLKISLFVESDLEVLKKIATMPVDAVEIHTGDYAKAHLNGENIEGFLNHYQQAHKVVKDARLGFHAGHGLTNESMVPLLKQNLFEEYNIGHWIICQAVFDGLSQVVGNLVEQFKQAGE